MTPEEYQSIVKSVDHWLSNCEMENTIERLRGIGCGELADILTRVHLEALTARRKLALLEFGNPVAA